MSNNFSNLGHDFLNYIQPMPHNIDQVGCRLCNRVFMNPQALIAHIESHMAQEEVAIRNLSSPNNIINSSQRGQFPPRFTSNLSMGENRRIFRSPAPGILHPRRNSFLSFGHHGASSSQQLGRQMLFQSPQVPICPQIMKWKEEEYVANDGTKAYIKQLEKPIKKIDFIDLDPMDDDDSDVHTLNLSLKL